MKLKTIAIEIIIGINEMELEYSWLPGITGIGWNQWTPMVSLK